MKPWMAFFCVILFFALAGCGSSSSDRDDSENARTTPDDAGPLQSTFVNSPVEGLFYETPTHSGFTDSDGRFDHEPGETVTFSIGGIVLGSVILEPGSTIADGVITPVDLVEGAVGVADPVVTNIARFIQTLDEDNDPSNGIRITEAVHAAAEAVTLDFNLSIEAFEDASLFIITTLTEVMGDTRLLVPVSQAQANLQNTLIGLQPGDPIDPPEEGEFGGLSLSGPGSEEVGTSFIPAPESIFSSIAPFASSVQWNTITEAGVGLGFGILVAGDELDNMVLVGVTQEGGFWQYGVNCRAESGAPFTPGDCSGVDVDLPGKVVQFSSVTLLPASGTNNSITLNGELRFP